MSDKDIEQQIQTKGLAAPRITLDDFKANIVNTEIVKHVSVSGQVLRWAVLTTKNGFAVTGKPSCSASSENDDAEIGEQIAIENAENELWPLMGYALKQRLHDTGGHTEEENFEHFLSHSGFHNEKAEVIAKLRKAYYDGGYALQWKSE
ncbi:Gp49 family protein [Klebsiella michiganensis]|uniref:Gp49 family protein n=1 Tax=Klebsiella michiganensis TaxID=1134687 RepID=UPI00388DD46D